MIALEVSAAAGRGGRPPRGGIANLIRGQVSALARIDPETEYVLCHKLSTWRRGHRFRPDAPNVRHRLLEDPLGGLLLPGAKLLHAMSSRLPRTPKIPKFVSVYDLVHLRHPEWVGGHHLDKRHAILSEMVTRADHVVTNSDSTGMDVQDIYGVPADRVHTVFAGVDRDVYRVLPACDTEQVRGRYGRYVLGIGLLTPRKNYPALIEAVAPLRDLRLVVVGARNIGTGAFFEAIERHGMRDRTVHLEQVDHDQLVRLMNGAVAFAHPSRFEGFGLVVLEAMACGTPVVCSSTTSLPEVAGNAALYADPKLPETFADALRRIVEDSELARDLRERGLARAGAMSWEASARSLRDLYRTTVGL